MALLFEAALSNAVIAAVLAAFALTASRRWKQPPLVHALWVLVLVKLVTPPIVHVPLIWPFATDDNAAVARSVTTSNVPSAVDRLAHSADAMIQSPVPGSPSQRKVRSVKAQRIITARRESATQLQRAASLSAVAPLAKATPRFGWTAVLMAVWFAGSALYMVVVLLRVIGFRRWVSTLGRAPQEVQRCAEQVARTVGLGRSPRVVLAPGRVSPMVWGFGKRATVLLPSELWRRLDTDEQAALLAHELAHLRRGDPWVRLLELSATAIYWWHPAVWWARRKIHEAEELCCDAFVVGAMSGRARAYADALLAAVEFLSDGPSKLAPAASGIAPVETLQRRLTMIMQGETLHNVSIWGRMTLFALAIVLLPMSLTWAEEKNEPPQKQGSTVVQATATENADEDAGEDEGEAEEANEAAQAVAEDLEELIEEVAEGIGKALEEIDGERLAEIIEEALEAIDFEKIGEAIEEALGGIEAVDEAEIEEAVEKALKGLDEEKIEAAIEKALEAVDEREIGEAIEKALEGLDEAEIEVRIEEALEGLEEVDIEGQIEEALQQIRELDIGEQVEEALEAIKDADIGKHIEEALSAIREADIEGAIRQALEGLEDQQIEEHAESAREHAEHARERAEDARDRGREGAARARRQAERARDRGRERVRQGRQRDEDARRRAERRRGPDEVRGERRERQPRETRRHADSDPERRKERLERRLQRLQRELDTVRRELGELSEKEEQRGDDDSPNEI